MAVGDTFTNRFLTDRDFRPASNKTYMITGFYPETSAGGLALRWGGLTSPTFITGNTTGHGSISVIINSTFYPRIVGANCLLSYIEISSASSPGGGFPVYVRGLYTPSVGRELMVKSFIPLYPATQALEMNWHDTQTGSSYRQQITSGVNLRMALFTKNTRQLYIGGSRGGAISAIVVK